MTTPSKAAKAAGFRTLEQFADIAGVPVGTLKDWHTNRPQTFEILLLGALALEKGRGLIGLWLPVTLFLPLSGVSHVILELKSGERRVATVAGGGVCDRYSGREFPAEDIACVMPFSMTGAEGDE